MRMASIEQLAEVPGFGGKAAAELKAFLEARSSETAKELEKAEPQMDTDEHR